ncbi:hypothetical protein DSO57_1028874 [Entomophthora muscae]|uniref:Uncharacterized protein n=1 Tax=Entomophthora muscae TaxID=34485 RepID=A0ACC2RG70_9FUNG|nr:hypothetical protein DSO57_1028874 [Entomophthora muscae]
MYGRNKLNQCFVSKDHEMGDILALFLVDFMSTATLLYCIFIPCIIMARININTKAFSHLKHYLAKQRPEVQSHFKRQLKKLIISSTLYPLSFFFSIIGSLVFVYYMYFAIAPSTSILVFAMVTRSCTGLFNLIAFSLDPTIQRALNATWKSFRMDATGQSTDNSMSSIPQEQDTVTHPANPFCHQISDASNASGTPATDQALQSYLKAI